MIRRPALRALALGLTLLSLTTGCSNSNTTAVTSSNHQLVVGIRQSGEVFDPLSSLPTEIAAVSSNIYEYLWERNTKAPKGEILGGLAETWTVSPDGKTIDITLRKGVKFHTGTEMTADDVAFSWSRLKANGFSDRLARTLQTIEVKDPYHVTLHFGQGEPAFIPQLGFPIGSKAYLDKVGDAQFKAQPVGTGPYQFVTFSKGEYIDLKAFPQYWGKKPQVQSVRFKFLQEDTTRIAALKTGEADIVMQVPYALVSDVKNTKNLRTVTQDPGGFTIFTAIKYINPKTPWADIRVRQAMAISIDQQAIVKSLFGGLPHAYPFLAPSDLGYDASLQNYEYNPDKAKQLLGQAGYPNGFSLNLPYIAGAATGIKETAEAMATYWAKIGIKATPQALEGAQFVQYVIRAGKDPNSDYVGVFIGSLAGKSDSSVGLATQFTSVTAFAWYHNPQVSGLALQSTQTWDDTQRGALVKQATNLIHTDYGFIPNWVAVNVFGEKSCVTFTPTFNDSEFMMVKDVTYSC